ncbi:MAG TPA: hypothetical protein DF613_01495 [Lachnospiraceae bacterium]|nr:hypothetical protein [Lachnospiraceae bacterium]
MGYQLPENDTPVNVIAGKENRIQVFNDQVAAGIKILKYDAETGKPDPQGGGTFENARFRIVTLQDCEIGPRQYRSGDVVYDALALDRDGYAETPANVLTEGRYRLEETGAPTGYLTGDSVEFAIAKSDHGKLKELTGGEIADPPIRGGLKIKKVDKDTKKASPQGNAVLEGARFEIVSLNENPVKVEGSEYLRGQTVYTMETGEDGTARTDARLLPYGSYAVQESSGGQPKGYLWNKDNYRTFSIDQDSDIVDLSGDPMEDPVVRGGVRISKYDGESGEMHPLGGASLENMEIVIYNESRKEVWVSGQMYRPGEIVHVMYTDADGYAETPADLLPYGSYRLVETAAPEGYLGKEEDDRGTYEQTITIERDGELVDRTGQGNGMTDFVKRGDFSIRKVNADTQKSMAGVVFRVTSMTTAESHVFMTDANGYYSTSSAYTPHSRNTNGGKSRDGMWFGLRADGGNTKVDDRLGALPCDTYRIEELAGDNNRGMVLFSDILTITENGKTIGLGTVENKEIAIGTTAKDSLTGTHYQTAEAGACIVDTVFYQNLDKGTSYTLRGRLVDQETGETVKDRDGNSISAEKAFTPTVSTGSVDVEFTFDASDFTGMTVVVFEELYQGGQKLAEHKEISDEGQTIRYPGIRTQAVDGQTLTDVSCATEEVTLIDRVSYTNLQAGRAYTLTGALMVKETGEAYVDPDGKPVAASRIFIPEASSGVAEVVFTFNGVNAAGRTLVAFEELSRGGQIYAVHTDLHDEDQTVYFPGIGTTASVESTGDRIAMAAASLAVTDRVAYSNLKAGQEYRLKGTLMLKETGEALLENGMPVTAEATFVPEEPEGTMDVKFVFDAENLAGNGVVVFEELYGNDRLVAFHKDIEDEGQTVYIPEIRTNAVDTKTQSHVADAAEEVTVRDTVTYTALIPGKTYKVVGTLMDKETGEAIETDGRAVTAEQIFQPLESDGTIDVIFQFNGMPLGGKTVVAFETLLYDEREVAAHRDIRDEGQSVAILAKGTVKGASTKVKKEDESTAQAEEKEKKPARKPSDVSGVSVRSTGAVKTGDTSHFLLWGILWLVSLSMLMFLRIKWKKGQRS